MNYKLIPLPSNERKIQSERARQGLVELLQEAGVSTLSASFSENRRLVETDEYVVSLSHTKEMGIVAIDSTKTSRSIGVDIEPCYREIMPKTVHFFRSEEDSRELSPLQLWVAKEAAYKALWPLITRQEELILKDIVVTESSFSYTKETTPFIGVIEFSEIANYLIAFALIESEN